MKKLSQNTTSRQGFTLVEVMIAGSVFTLIFLSALSAMQHGFKLIDTARNTTIAAQIIQSEIEDLRLKAWGVLSSLPAETQIDIAQSIGSGLSANERTSLAQRFTANRRIADVPDRDNNLKRIIISVTWADASGLRHNRSYETLFSHFGLSDYFVAEHSVAP
jgi:Tfp pilus assembly protein PilV